MAEITSVATDNVLAIAYPPDFDCPKAGEIVTSVRDMIPDPVYDDEGEPLPDVDGDMFRASTLYRWLTAGIRELTRRANWVVQDWAAVAQQSREGIYRLPYRFANIDAAFCNKYRLAHLDEVHTIYPSFSSAQPLWFAYHHRSDHVELALWPVPDRTDPRVTLMSTMDAITTTIDLSSTEGFLSPGWLRIESEILQYSALSTELDPAASPGVRIVRRGLSGSAAALHFAGVPVEHCGIWVRGWRAPIAVKFARDCVELPFAFQHPLENFVLSKCKQAEQDMAGAHSLMQAFLEEVNSLVTDPMWQTPHTVQSSAYGAPAVGPLFHGRVVVP